MTTMQKEASNPKKHIEDLRRQLREAELSSAVQETSGTLSVVSVTRDAEETQLGPTVFVDMEVNDVKIAALVDTGSTATIISLPFVLQILADQRDRSLTPAQWREETLKRFSPPEVALKSYGGHRVDIVSQIPL